MVKPIIFSFYKAISYSISFTEQTLPKYKWTLVFAASLFIFPVFLDAQTIIRTAPEKGLRIGLNAGYDFPDYHENYPLLEYKGGPKFGATVDYYFTRHLGIGADYDYIKNKPNSLIPSTIFYIKPINILWPTATVTEFNGINRQFIGVGPNFKLRLSNRIDFELGARAGLGKIKGGDILVTATDPNSPYPVDIHQVHTGYNDWAFSGKIKTKVNFAVNEFLSFNVGAYYLRHFSVHLDDQVDINNMGNIGIYYGENVFNQDPITGTDFVVGNNSALVVKKPSCVDISSIGVTAGMTITFPQKCNNCPCKCNCKEKKTKNCKCKCIGKANKTCNCKAVTIINSPCNNNCCPDDRHKVIVIVRDRISGKVIPGADVILKDIYGKIIATGTTNAYGAGDLGEVMHGNYIASSKVYGIETTIATIVEAEFVEGTSIEKDLFYEDLNFILKGKTINNNDNRSEPNVLASLINKYSGSVKQNTSDQNGGFQFRLEPNSQYEISGKKNNRLSDIEQVSTVGLTRSTTLFVELELGVEKVDCETGTILDVHYPHDVHTLSAAAKMELDKVVRFMIDHPTVKVELSSHTSSVGADWYNEKLSTRRAQTAVSYILSKGIASWRLIGTGYGERRLLNRCADGVNCPESMHQQNRRTEIKLICN